MNALWSRELSREGAMHSPAEVTGVVIGILGLDGAVKKRPQLREG
jgi:hypothetical protein